MRVSTRSRIPAQSQAGYPPSKRKNFELLTATEEDERRSSSIKSLTKVMTVLECFSRKSASLTPAEISQLTGLPRATTHRIVSSLRDIGLLEQNKRRETYKLGMKLFQLGSLVLANMDLEKNATAHITKLQRITGEAIHLCVFDGSQMVFVERQDMGTAPISTITRIEAAPVYSTGVGKAFLAFQAEALVRKTIAEGLIRRTVNTIVDGTALLAELEIIREQGFAVDMEENELNIRCVAAPIRDSSGRVFAAISVSGSAVRMLMARLVGLAPTVIETARAISADLGWETSSRQGLDRRRERSPINQSAAAAAGL
ncbi:MAG: IclR family transcriptional regulator [Acidobacteriaceae bacterium]